MEIYRFQLEKSSKKHTCPSCGKRRFVRFIDTQTGYYLPPTYGRCDREANCNYYLIPYADNFAAEVLRREKENQPAQWQSHPIPTPKHQPTAKPVYIPFEILQATRNRPLSKNIFIQNLATNIPFPFEMADLKKVTDLYQLGTLAKGFFEGAISFPFIDHANRIRAIQIKQFNQQNHTTRTSFIHAIIERHYRNQNKALPDWLIAYQLQEKKVSCLFGEHLLALFPENPVALVEAPKTCVYGTLYFGFPEEKQTNLLWLSTYNLSSLMKEKIAILEGRTVVLFPDLSSNGTAFKLWSEKAKQFEEEIPGTRFVVSDLLEQNATTEERKKGFDLADYLILQNWRDYRTPMNKTDQTEQMRPETIPAMVKQYPPQQTNLVERKEKLQIGFPEPDQAETNPAIFDEVDLNHLIEVPVKPWDLTEIETFFSNLNQLPSEPIQFAKGQIIKQPAKFVASHLATVKANNGIRTFEPYLLRLVTLKKMIEDGKVSLYGRG